jgi:hypothetical protein
MIGMRISSLILAALVAASCGSPEGGVEAQSRVPDSLVVTTDPELRALAHELLPGILDRSGLELREPVRLARRSREELQAYLLGKMDEELPPDRARDLVAAYSMLGLVEADVDLRQLLLSVYQEQVAGFYDPDSTALFVMDDQGASALRPLLAHELVHALQDQAVALDELTDPAAGHDRATAAQAAVEGHATLVMFEVSAGPGVDLTRVPGFGDQLRSMMATAGSGYPELEAAPRIVRESILLPYLEGTSFVLAVWQGRGRVPFDELVPSSTEQILSPDRFLAEPPDEPTELEVSVEGAVPRFEDALGAAEVRILLEERVGPEAGSAVAGWDGDRLLLLGDAGSPTLVWASVWDDAASRDRFLETLRPGLPDGPAVEWKAVDVGGRPGALLTIGPDAEGVRVELAGP